ncbi:TRAP transporter small permease [Bacillus massiliigorillae]|uniref:TRAP transporter small permease n=1 Tax=Bacillus massiliigorillae TaxID=1243664 RepID=UPI0003A690DF|nr:TRAP transporter small permease [Bacillus massiliigorillae]
MIWNKAINGINKVSAFLTSTFLVLMVILVFIQIVSRIIFQSSFSWTEEVSRYLMIWLTFIGAAFSFQHGAHVGVELLTSKLPAKVSAILQVFVAILCMILFYVMIVKGLELVDHSSLQHSPALRLPMSFVYLIIPISGVLMALNMIDITIKNVKKAFV